MPDDHVILWRRCGGKHDLCCEVVQVAEGYFELRLLDGGQVIRREASGDVAGLLGRAEEWLAAGRV